MLPSVSIITVVYNAADDLRLTLENLLKIHYDNLELIVIDGGSTDGTRGVIEEHSVEISHWLSEPDEGIYDAMNKGLKMASGDYVWFINAGDTVCDEYVLENIFKGREQYADVYYGETLILSKEGEIKGLRRKKLPRRLTWHSLKAGMVVCHQSFIAMRDIVPMYDTKYRYAADIDWVIETLRRSKKIEYTHTILSVFREGGVSTSHRKESLIERFRIMRHYYGLFRTLISHVVFVAELFGPKYRKPGTKTAVIPPSFEAKA